VVIEYYDAKSLMRTSTPSLFFWSEVYLNPYQGCYHNCVYCDGKAEGYYMHEDFAERIRVKRNAPKLLEAFFRKKGFIPINREQTSTLLDFIPSAAPEIRQPGKFILFIGGGVCDVYQPAEIQVTITRKLLRIAHDYRFPVGILTKNVNVLRDLDLLKTINDESYASVSFTITLAEEKTQQIFEPRASTTQERFQAIKTLRKEGIHSGVYCYPVLPFIGDTNENLDTIYRTAKKRGAEFVYCGGLTLKPGRNKEEFLRTLERQFPSLLHQYKTLYGNDNKYGTPDSEQFAEMGVIRPEIAGYVHGYEHGIPYTSSRYIPEGRIASNLRLSEFLMKIAYLKTWILQSPHKVRSLHRAVAFLENFEDDITAISEKECRSLPFAKNVLFYIEDFLENGKDTSLEKLEKEAYEAACEKISA
jgi:DNA repair photolyase